MGLTKPSPASSERLFDNLGYRILELGYLYHLTKIQTKHENRSIYIGARSFNSDLQSFPCLYNPQFIPNSHSQFVTHTLQTI